MGSFRNSNVLDDFFILKNSYIGGQDVAMTYLSPV